MGEKHGNTNATPPPVVVKVDFVLVERFPKIETVAVTIVCRMSGICLFPAAFSHLHRGLSQMSTGFSIELQEDGNYKS
ncbi:Hypothetical protein CINCED_3A004706 [Cinara cedri]|uniref:Uncharacterized protein n=1 Tax=Cinara cedri TaxID=506608 RepID=A0A5E4MM24_9HEMI|nr:Hypothetical protein CINCED_3A004706 [Cinara cedri]